MKTASEIPHVFERTIPEEISALNALRSECASAPRMLKDTNVDSVEKYLSDERAYAQFVYETSLLLTPEATAAMAEIFGEAPPALALSDILPLVLSALKENITYDETVKTDCGTNDFAAYVLRVGKRGYSVHYQHVLPLC